MTKVIVEYTISNTNIVDVKCNKIVDESTNMLDSAMADAIILIFKNIYNDVNVII